MASIQSVLIQTCMAKIQKDVAQLESWLLELSNGSDLSARKERSDADSNDTMLQDIYRALDHLSKDMKVQQMTANHIVDRLDVLETNQRHMENGMKKGSSVLSLNDAVWMDSVEESPYATMEPIYMVKKEEPVVESVPCEPVVSAPVVSAPVVSAPVVAAPVVSAPVVSAPVVTAPVVELKAVEEVSEVEEEEPEVEVEVEEEEEQEEQEPEVEEEEEQEEQEPEVEEEEEQEEQEPEVEEEEEQEPEVEEEPVKEAPKAVEMPKVVEAPKEEEPEDEEALEEFEFKGVRYCKDSDNNVYTLDEDDTPSDDPVGHWSQKMNTIKFYSTKK